MILTNPHSIANVTLSWTNNKTLKRKQERKTHRVASCECNAGQGNIVHQTSTIRLMTTTVFNYD